MYYVSKYSKKKLLHRQDCSYGCRIKKKNRICYSDMRLAIADGYRLCKCCSPIYKRCSKYRKAIDAFCSRKGITWTIDSDVMRITTDAGEWLIWCHPVTWQMFLYHRNTFRKYETMEHSNSIFPGYHLHNFTARIILPYLYYISRHDAYRKDNPPQNKVKPIKHRHRSKHWKDRNMEKTEELQKKKHKNKGGKKSGKYSRENSSVWLKREMEGWGGDDGFVDDSGTGSVQGDSGE